MQSIIALLAVLVGVAFAHRMDISSDDLDKLNKDISAKEYLKRIFKNSLMLGESHIELSSKDAIDDLIAKLPALGLNEASLIANRVNLKQIIRDSNRTSLTLCLPSDKAVKKWRQEEPNSPEALKQLVKAWIVPEVVRYSTVTNNQMVKSLNGAKLRYNVYNDIEKIVTVNGAKIAKVVEVASNLIIQVVDKAIYPLPIGNVIQTLADVDTFSVFIDLVKRAELSDLENDPITVFVPTNEAFKASFLVDFIKRDKTRLTKVLKYHVVSDVKYSASFSSGQRIASKQGDQISVDIVNGDIILNEEEETYSSRAPRVIKADIPTTNGVIHVINQILLPKYLVSDLEH